MSRLKYNAQPTSDEWISFNHFWTDPSMLDSAEPISNPETSSDVDATIEVSGGPLIVDILQHIDDG